MVRWLAGSLLIVLAIGCKDDPQPTRGYRMGFQNSGPRYELDLFVRSLNEWTQRSDAAMITTEVPWQELYEGVSPVTYVQNNYGQLVQTYRSKNLRLWVYIDPQNGLDRTSDAVALVARGKSIADPDVQAVYRRFVVVMDSLLKPEHLGLALETNLIRAAAPPANYEGVRQAAGEAAVELRNRGSQARLSVSVQAEQAWGKFSDNIYQGIAQDLSDFSFLEELGISSYPYLVFATPADIPENYYARLVSGLALPCFVTEGGWSSSPAGPFDGSAQNQADYFRQHHDLLQRAGATAWFQLLYTDLDISSFPPPVPPNLQFFASIGVVDVNFNPKPALAVWDEWFRYRTSF